MVQETQAKTIKEGGIMKSFAIYHLCQEAFSFHQQQLVEVIVKAAKPDMIFLLGAALNKKKCESIFNEVASSCQQISDCTLLILLPNLANKELHDWQDKIEKNCSDIMPVTALVLQTSTFVEWLQGGLPFAWLHGNKLLCSTMLATFVGKIYRSRTKLSLAKKSPSSGKKD
jgi:hypothetical protein